MKKFVPVAGVPPWRSTVEPNRELEAAFNIEPSRNELGYRWFTQRRNISQDHLDFVHAHPSVIHDRSPFY